MDKKEKVGLASFCPEESGISWSRLEYFCPTFVLRTPNLSDLHTKVDAVTHSFPSPIISCIESVPRDAHISHLELANSEDGNSKSYNREASTSKVLRDVHIVRIFKFQKSQKCFFGLLMAVFSFPLYMSMSEKL